MQSICATCGKPFTANNPKNGPKPEYCGRKCWPSSTGRHDKRVPDERSCKRCSNTFSRKERGGSRAAFCSDICLKAHQRERRAEIHGFRPFKRSCNECGLPIRGGQYCEQHRSARTKQCVECDQQFVGSSKIKYCSDECRWLKRKVKRKVEQVDIAPAVALDWTQCPVCDTWVAKRGRKYCSGQCRNRAGNAKSQGVDIKRKCNTCGVNLRTLKRRLCDDCRNESLREQRRKLRHLRKHISRAQHFGVRWERFDPREIFERDRWRCGICHEKVDKRLSGDHPRGATLDHIIPLSWRIWEHGHTRANSRCAHRDCNTNRGNRIADGEQLALVG